MAPFLNLQPKITKMKNMQKSLVLGHFIEFFHKKLKNFRVRCSPIWL